jgi:AP2 domain/HNH endonuclease
MDTLRLTLTRGKSTLIDADDLLRVASLKWCAAEVRPGYWYAVTDARGQRLYLHRFLMQPPVGLEVDHRNHDRLDNRKTNLRVCTHAENLWNRKGPAAHGTSGFRGVSWDKNAGLWLAHYRGLDGKLVSVGRYDTAEAAAAARNAAAESARGPDEV